MSLDLSSADPVTPDKRISKYRAIAEKVTTLAHSGPWETRDCYLLLAKYWTAFAEEIESAGPIMMATPEQFRSAMDACVEAYDKQTAPQERRCLASAALVFAQVAEYVERGNPVTQAIVRHCNFAVSLVSDDHARREIEARLSHRGLEGQLDTHSPCCRE